MTAKKLASLLLSIALFAFLAGCSNSDSDNSEVRVLNASIDYGAVDVYFDDQLKQTNVAPGAITAYLDYKAESKTLKVTRTGSTSAVLETTVGPGKKIKHLYVIYGSEGGLRVNQYSENESEASSGKTKVRVLNVSADAGAVDFFASTSATEVNDLLARTQSIGYGGVTSWQEIDKGTYRGWLTAAGDKSDIRLQIPSIILEDRKLVTVVLTPTTGGTLLNAQVVSQQGDATKTENDKARLRLVAGLSSGERIVVNSAQGERLLSNASPSISSYALVPKGSNTLNITANGATFATLNTDFVAGSDNTLLTYGTIANDGTNANGKAVVLRDGNRAPTQSSRAKVRLINGFVESATGLTLSADYSPIVSNVAAGAASDYGLLSGGSYSRLDVSEATGSAPLYLSTDTITFASGAVYSMFMIGTRSAPIGILRKDR